VFAAPEFMFIGTSLCSAPAIMFLRFLVITMYTDWALGVGMVVMNLLFDF